MLGPDDFTKEQLGLLSKSLNHPRIGWIATDSRRLPLLFTGKAQAKFEQVVNRKDRATATYAVLTTS